MSRLTDFLNRIFAPRVTKTYINMTPEEAKEFEQKFEKMEKAFEEMEKIFRDL